MSGTAIAVSIAVVAGITFVWMLVNRSRKEGVRMAKLQILSDRAKNDAAIKHGEIVHEEQFEKDTKTLRGSLTSSPFWDRLRKRS